MFESFAHTIAVRGRGLYGNKIRGVVVSNNDPQNRGRLKIRARDIHDDIPDDQLPWSTPHAGFGDGVKGSGKKDAPAVGAYVFLDHQDDSPYHSQYHSGPATDDKQIPELNQNTPGHVDRAGNLHSRAYGQNPGDDNTITDQHQSGTGKVIAKDGTVTKNNVKDVTENTYGDNHKIQGDTNTVLTLNYKKIILQCNELQLPQNSSPGPAHSPPGNKPEARETPTFTTPSGTTY